jgi:hypothetical protein
MGRPRPLTDPDLPGWTFTAGEISYGVWRINGTHHDGRSVGRIEHGNFEAGLAECVKDARELPPK